VEPSHTQITKYLLIGGGLASSRAGDQIRNADPDGSITLVTDEPFSPYDRPPLSKEFLRRERTADDLTYRSVEDLADRRIDLLTNTRVDSLDPARLTARLSDGSALGFEQALIATGGRPARLGLPGENLLGVHYLRTITDAAAILGDAEAARRVVIIGAGFIGIEAAASLTALGLQVTVLETASRIWPHFADDTIANFFQRYGADRGVDFCTGETATAIRGARRASTVVTASGREWECDLVLIAVGLVPNVELADRAGLTVDGGIVVDSQMRTSHPAIYAAGDVVAYPDPVFGKRRRVEHWGHAEHSGQVAGLNMADVERHYGLLSYVWSDVFDLHVEFAGDESGHDTALVRGDLDAASFTVLYLRDHHLTAYCAVNGDRKDFGPLQKLIRRKVDLTGKDTQLTDPLRALRTLL
jgi:NADPH-dependent 2,4-dienoyl-CoA reductase/sulfur reductase-like enzyme